MSSKKEAPVYDAQDFVKKAPQLFKVQPEVMAGALLHVKEPITIDQAKKLLNDFLVRPISNKGGIA